MGRIDLALAAYAGGVAETHEWGPYEVVTPDELHAQHPSGPTLAVISAGELSLATVRSVAALIGAGRNVVVVTDVQASHDTWEWLPRDVVFDGVGLDTDTAVAAEGSAYGEEAASSMLRDAMMSMGAPAAPGQVMEVPDALGFETLITDRTMLEEVRDWFGSFIAEEASWNGPELAVPVRSPLGRAGTVRLRHCRGVNSGEPCVRILVPVARGVSASALNVEGWNASVSWALRKAEAYYLIYTGLVESTADRAESLRRDLQRAGTPVKGPLSNVADLADPAIPPFGANQGAFPSAAGARVMSLGATLSIGWELPVGLASMVMAIYGHRAALALIDLAVAAPGWLDEIGGKALAE